jgi:hypothetical protein
MSSRTLRGKKLWSNQSLTNKHTNSTGQTTPGEGDTHLSKKIPHYLWKPGVHYREECYYRGCYAV